MAEGELAGEPHHDIPRLAGVSEEQEKRHHRQKVLDRRRRAEKLESTPGSRAIEQRAAFTVCCPGGRAGETAKRE